MASKYAPVATLNQELVYLTGCNLMTVCSASSSTYADMYSGSMLASVSMISGSSGGDYTIAADVNGQKVTTNAKSGVSITNSGTAVCVALLETTGSTIRWMSVRRMMSS